MSVDPLPQHLALPQAPALVAGVRQAAWLNPTGKVEIVSLAEAAERLQDNIRPVVCHAQTQAARLRVPPFAAFDVLELYAFVRPARFALPTPRGLAQALGLKLPASLESEAGCLIAAAGALLTELADGADDSAAVIAQAMDRGGWPWAPAVLAALGHASARAGGDLRVWRRLDDWQE
ncbi:MAG: ATP-dependent DNA helicase, partial [Rhodospirillales bacterium]